jgi:hypothetical protein
MANQTPTSKPGIAFSATVGTCGRMAMRCADAVARAFTLPVSTN